ncbi:predicted protein [Naegleria gruberi]|uniref:Predicted protein n=1 Tax=Naegleria gruberi TaxID=5762 RepID=D2VE63_NAEGR|nr:uncharacterized protein NAEGRDRAFT_67167 [Naegleria gruberi]EFC44827.1 predicted protein [Naegleria gruberi]|eukprot:XP_002677571.1 predicted protein [Naegleria gruberi strain NEG-M]
MSASSSFSKWLSGLMSSSSDRCGDEEETKQFEIPSKVDPSTTDNKQIMKQSASSSSNKNKPSESTADREISIDSLPMMEEHPEGKITIVHMSDSHISHQYLKTVPDGDIFIHSGDISHKSEWYDLEDRIENAVQTNPNVNREEMYESVPSIISFNEWIGKLPHKIKIVIAGNHEIGFNGLSPEFIQKRVLKNVIYLQDQSLLINYRGTELLRLYGSPWTTSSRMGFSISWKIIKTKWDKIPLNTDVLITHMPPFGIMDLASTRDDPYYCEYCKKEHKYRGHWGDNHLRNKVIELNSNGRLQAHLYGHVHEFHATAIEPQTKDTPKPLIYSNAASVLTHSDTRIKTPNIIEILPHKNSN